MQVGEQHETLAQQGELVGLRLLDLADEVGPPPHVSARGHDRRAGRGVLVVGDRRLPPGIGLDQHVDAVLGQLAHTVRRDRDAVLVVLDLGGNTDGERHGRPSDGAHRAGRPPVGASDDELLSRHGDGSRANSQQPRDPQDCRVASTAYARPHAPNDRAGMTSAVPADPPRSGSGTAGWRTPSGRRRRARGTGEGDRARVVGDCRPGRAGRRPARHTRRIDWVQLPWAGIEPYRDVLDGDRRWTCAKGVYAEPVAELALTLLLGGLARRAALRAGRPLDRASGAPACSMRR